MKYLASGTFTANKLMRLTLGATLFFLLLFWGTSLAMYFAKMDLSPASVIAYYRGSPASFKMPRTFGSMLEVTHGHLPVMAIVGLLLTHLFIFTPAPKSRKLLAIATLFAAAFLNEAAGWLVRFIHPGFAWLKIVSFSGLEVSLLYLIVALARLLRQPGAEKYRRTEQRTPQRPAAGGTGFRAEAQTAKMPPAGRR